MHKHVICTGCTQNVTFFKTHSQCQDGTQKFQGIDNVSLFIYLLYYAIIKRSVKLNRLLYRHLRDTFMSKRKRHESEPAGYVATHLKKLCTLNKIYKVR